MLVSAVVGEIRRIEGLLTCCGSILMTNDNREEKSQTKTSSRVDKELWEH